MVEKSLFLKAAYIVRDMSKDADQTLIRPLSDEEMTDASLPTARVQALCIWQTREAYVSLFSHIAGFDVETFRLCCLPKEVQLPENLCPQCGEDMNHFSQRIRGGHTCYPSKR